MQSCDLRLLDDVKAVEGLRALQFVQGAQPVAFRHRSDEKQKHILGWVAQDVQKQIDLVYGEHESYSDIVRASGKYEHLHINPTDLNVILFAAVRQLSQELDALKLLQHNSLLDQGLRINKTEHRLNKLEEDTEDRTRTAQDEVLFQEAKQMLSQPTPSASAPPPEPEPPAAPVPAHAKPATKPPRPIGPQNLKHPTSRPLSRPSFKRKEMK